MIRGAVLRGLSALLVEVEVGVRGGRDRFNIVGLGGTAVKESRNRLQLATETAGFEWPLGSITVNLAPADVPKDGTTLDLAIALAILEATGQMHTVGSGTFAVGELALNGRVRRCRGGLAIARAIPRDGTILVPRDNRHEFALLRKLKGMQKRFRPFVVDDLAGAARCLSTGKGELADARKEDFVPAFGSGVDFAEVKGQARAKRGLEVAAAGGHNVLFIGPPGEGKSLLAKALPTILPRLSPPEIVELTEIYGARGDLHAGHQVVLARPYRPVHHTASPVSVVGGGSGFPLPGEITLAHRGVLFLDELPEFSHHLLETLRQPLEDGEIHLVRKNGAATYPCEFVLVAAMNPCACGFRGQNTCQRCNSGIEPHGVKCPECGSQDISSRCRCSDHQVRSYTSRVSGPIMDRIDLKIAVDPLSVEERFSGASAEKSASIRQRVERVRTLQDVRFRNTDISLNARIPGGAVERFCELHDSARRAIIEVEKRLPELSTRGHDKLLKVSRTVADLNASGLVYKKHIREAGELCGHHALSALLGEDDEQRPCPSCGAECSAAARFCSQCGGDLSRRA